MNRHAVSGLAVLVVAGAAAVCVPLANDYVVGIGLNLLMWIALTQSWALFSGLCGYISLGHAVFFGVGAYVMVSCWELLPTWLIVPIAGLIAATLALALGWPCLRVRGPYFVILSFGVAEFLKYVVVSTEAAMGRTGQLLIGTPSLVALFDAMLVLAVFSSALLYGVGHSRLGSALIAIREDETAAEAIGINPASAKIAAFTLSALMPGMVGAVMILRATYFEPLQAFSPVTSFTIVSIGIIGGSDAVPGPLLGAVFLVLLSEWLWAQAPEIYMILLGALLVTFVLFVPDGVYGRLHRLIRRER